jgi:hypothetical protein
MLVLFIWIAWFWLFISVVVDIFRSRDLSGWGKAAWALFAVIVPLLGVFVYLIARGSSMQDRSIQEMQERETASRRYIESVVGGGGTADELEKLQQLRQNGTIDDAEFQQLKAKVLAS